MALLKRPSERARRKRALWRLRAWLALRLQKRRRGGLPAPEVVPSAPFIRDAGYGPNEYEPEWTDVWVSWTFSQAGLPLGTFEVWCQWDASDELVATVPGSDRVCFLTNVTQGEVSLYYRVRYRDGALVGPFSNVRQVDVSI